MKGALMPSRLPLVGLQICNKIVRTATEWLARQNGRGLEEGKNKLLSSEHFHSITPESLVSCGVAERGYGRRRHH